MNKETNTLLEAASSCLTEAIAKKAPESSAKGSDALSDKENKDILEIIAKYIDPSKLNRAAESIFAEISKNAWIYPNDGVIRRRYGNLSLDESNKTIAITVNGNMNTTMKNVDQSLSKIGYPTIDALKKMFPKFTEKGSPDYSYSIIFKKTNPK